LCIYYTEVICFGLSPQCPFIKKLKIKFATAGFGSSFKLRWREAVGGFLRLLLRHVACNIKHALRQIPGAEIRFLGFDFLMLLTFYSCIIFPLSIACLTPQTGLVHSALAAMLLHQEFSRQTCFLFASHILALLYEKCSKQHMNHKQSLD